MSAEIVMTVLRRGVTVTLALVVALLVANTAILGSGVIVMTDLLVAVTVILVNVEKATIVLQRDATETLVSGAAAMIA